MERQPVAKAQKSAPRSDPLQRQSGSSSAGHPLLELQRSIGNQAVQRLIRSYVQTKLQVSTPADPFEQEADRVADTVMRMEEPESTEEEAQRIQAKPLATQIIPLVQCEFEQPLEEQKEEAVATKPVVQRVPLAVREDDDEEKVAPELDTNPSPQAEAKEKTVETKLAKDTRLQRQAREDEDEKEETLQTAPPIQRQMEEEEEEVQTKPLSSQLSQPAGTSPVPAYSADGAIQRVCLECEGEKQREERQNGEMVHRQSAPEQLPDDEVEEQQVQPKGADSATPSVTASVAANIHALNGGGSPLPDTTRAFFEPRFGADFSHVRVHTDSRAADTANSINAKAFTVGQNIAFGRGRYAPHSSEGRQLLAHELTHVVQQNGSQLQRSNPAGSGESRIVSRDPLPGPSPDPTPGPTPAPGPSPGPTPGPSPSPSPGPTPGPSPSPSPPKLREPVELKGTPYFQPPEDLALDIKNASALGKSLWVAVKFGTLATGELPISWTGVWYQSEIPPPDFGAWPIQNPRPRI